MTRIRHMLAIALPAFVLAVGIAPALAGAPGSNNRLAELVAVCDGGNASGLGCTSSSDCPEGRCQVVSDGTRRRPLAFLANLVIDDDTGEWNEDQEVENIHTVSITLDFVARGQRRKVAQTYMNVKGEDAEALVENMRRGVEIADLPNSDRRLDEALANAAVRDRGIIDDFLFQRPDGRIEDKLRQYFDTTGNFVVVRNRGVRIYADEEDNPLATVFQVRLDVVVTAE